MVSVLVWEALYKRVLVIWADTRGPEGLHVGQVDLRFVCMSCSKLLVERCDRVLPGLCFAFRGCVDCTVLIYTHAHRSVYIYTHICIHKHINIYTCIHSTCVHLSIHVCVCLSICLPAQLSIYRSFFLFSRRSVSISMFVSMYFVSVSTSISIGHVSSICIYIYICITCSIYIHMYTLIYVCVSIV